MKEPLSAEVLEGVDILVLGAPQEKFSLAEFETLKQFIQDGGRGLYAFPFKLKLSSSVRRITQLNS